MINITEWSKISADSFKNFQFDSGMIVKNFNPASISPPADADIICTTTGNITASLVPTTANLGDDVNNLHIDAKELMYIQKWVGTLSFTALEMSTDAFKLALGAADISGNGVTARMNLTSNDFQNLALVMKLVGGGLAAVMISNALSTNGISITTTKEGKGNLAVTMTAFSSIASQSTVPMSFYALQSTGITITAQPEDTSKTAGTAATFSVTATGTSLTYQWQVLPVGGATYSDIASATSATLSLSTSDVTTAASGNKYRCKIADANGYIYSDSATLTVTASGV